MKQNLLIVGAAAIVGLAAFTLLPAQEPSPVQFKMKEVVTAYGARLVNGSTVTGAPYSADSVTESTHVLGDGNRIVQSSSIKLYRDSQGRERQEEGGPDTKRILISDPVAKSSFTLDPQARTAQKSGAAVWLTRTSAGDALQTLELKLRDAERQRVLVSAGVSAGNDVAFYVNNGTVTTLGSGSPEPLREQLSPKNIEGVFANGTRTTLTIPAGQIGNEQPIKVVDEIWYSPDLQMNVMTKHSDPRSGEVVYQLKNIRRGEPDPSLFQVPPDYKINEGAGGGGRGRGGAVQP